MHLVCTVQSCGGLDAVVSAEHSPAIVTRVDAQDPFLVNLYVFPDLALTANTPYPVIRVPFDRGGSAEGTWHWPE